MALEESFKEEKFTLGVPTLTLQTYEETILIFSVSHVF